MKRSPNAEIERIAAEAAELGLSYGEYVRRQYEAKRFSERPDKPGKGGKSRAVRR